MGLSIGFQQSVLVLIVMGLLMALTLAWYHGEKGAQRVTVTEGVILTALVLITGMGLWTVRARQSIATPTTLVAQPVASGRSMADGYSIAVLPFDELTQPIEELRIPDAIHDQILTHLAQVPGLNPKSRTSVVALAGHSLTTRQIADTLDADYVLEATLQHVPPVLSINAQLIEPISDEHVWADVRQFQVADFFALQEEVADWVTESVQLALGIPLIDAVHASSTSQDAYRLYLDGRTFANSRGEADLGRAIQAYVQALELDPDFAQALSSLSLAYALWGHYGYGGENASYETFGQALQLVERAVELEPGLAAAHAVRGYLLSKAMAPAAEVEAAFERSLELAPASSDARILYAGFLAREGRFSEAVRESQIAIELDPIAPGRDSGLGYNALAAGDLQVALDAARRASVLQSDLLAPRIIQALSLVLMDRASECLELDLGPYDAVRAVCLHANGQEAEATRLIGRVLQSDGPRNAQLHVASYHAWTGDADRAADAVTQAFVGSPHGLDYRVVASGIFDAVRNDPGFRDQLTGVRAEVWNRVRGARDAAVADATQ